MPWAAGNDLCLQNIIDVPTNPHGNTIDLAFTNTPLAEANVEDHLSEQLGPLHTQCDPT